MAFAMIANAAMCAPMALGGEAVSARRNGVAGVQVASKVAVPARMGAAKRGGAVTSARLLPAELPAGVTVEKMGKDIFNSTYYPRGEDTDCARKPWIVIDAAGLRLGRLSTLVATYLRGGNVATYSPSMNMGTYVVVINAEQVVVSGKKFDVGYKLSVVDP